MAPHRIDVHHHILPPQYVDQVGDALIGPISVAGKTPEWSPARSIEVMDRHGIATSLTSISAPGFIVGDDAAMIRLVRDCNDYAARLGADHPGRFGMFAGLPLPDVDASLAEIAYALDELGAEGIGLMTNYDSRYPGDPAFAPVFDELDRRGAVVYFHPTTASCNACQPEFPPATLDFPFDTTRAIASLLYGGTLARCRNIKWIFSHAGGTVPFLAQRIARLAARPNYKAMVPNGVIPELQRLYYDTALSANWLAFRSLFELVTPDHVLFGSDYPFAPEATLTASVEALRTMGLDPAVLRGIERENALVLLPQLASA
jgi:predicted TIM-barrel fold metal-dependent hydrolase